MRPESGLMNIFPVFPEAFQHPGIPFPWSPDLHLQSRPMQANFIARPEPQKILLDLVLPSLLGSLINPIVNEIEKPDREQSSKRIGNDETHDVSNPVHHFQPSERYMKRSVQLPYLFRRGFSRFMVPGGMLTMNGVVLIAWSCIG